ncbi:MAG: SDR family oxidoreductase [Rhodospirillales bacterium]|nr:SDR family oxidoreductase [Rhodospirillales bacterium]
MGKLQKKVAIVTGSGRGIGREIALKLAAEGAHVVVNDLDDGPATEVTIEINGGAGPEALPFPGDVTETDFGDRIVQATLDKFGRLDIVVNNAGYIWNTSILNHTDEQWDAMMAVHATAPFRLLRAAGKYFRAEAKKAQEKDETPPCRKVVNISSVAGVYGGATQSSYSAGKAAVIGLTKALCKEWGPYNVTVNAVAFGYIQTRLTQTWEGEKKSIDVKGRKHGVGFPEEAVDHLVQMTPLRRAGRPEDAAGAVLLFCLPESDFVTGEVLVASGGLTW